MKRCEFASSCRVTHKDLTDQTVQSHVFFWSEERELHSLTFTNDPKECGGNSDSDRDGKEED